MIHTLIAILVCLSIVGCSQKGEDKPKGPAESTVQVASDIIDDKSGMPVRMKII